MNKLYKEWTNELNELYGFDHFKLFENNHWFIIHIPKDGRDFNRHELKPGRKYWTLCKDTVLWELENRIETMLGKEIFASPRAPMYIYRESDDNSSWEVLYKVRIGSKIYNVLKEIGFEHYCD